MSITMTTSATRQIQSMLATNNLSEAHVVRLGVTAGGCSGYSYLLDITDEIHANDRIFASGGVQIVCDPKSYLYVKGTEIDYEDSLMGGGFKFGNPNVKRSCGCGTSFQA